MKSEVSIRRITELDKPVICEWLSRDEVHQKLGITYEDVTAKDTVAYLVSDERGPIMVFRLHRAVRAAFQFNPDASYRTAKAAKHVIEFIAELAKNGDPELPSRSKEILIRPGGKAVAFAEALGFEEFEGCYLYRLIE